MDPRGKKGSWEGIVQVVNEEKTRTIRKIASHAQWFEDRMPWDPKYRKGRVRGIVANAIDVLVEAGDSGPITPVGINLPNPQDLREKYGSKSVSLSNVVEAHDKSRPKGFRREFCATEEEYQRAEKWSSLTEELTTDMHEVIGHASGRASAELDGDPAEHIREYYSGLEEARADLVALWFIADPKLRELGLVPDAEAALAEYESYTRNALLQLRRVPEGAQLEEDHMRNRQMIVHWLMANTGAISVERRGEKTYYRVADAEAWRAGVGRLLAEVQRVKSEGDFAAAKRLFDAYGISFDPRLRDEVLARVRALDLPSYTAFVMPRLTALRDARGEIADIQVSYPLDLETQMLEWSGRRAPPESGAERAEARAVPAEPAGAR
jgi:dipeptidyl-peptidase-3